MKAFLSALKNPSPSKGNFPGHFTARYVWPFRWASATALGLGLMLVFPPLANAFPPAPHHLIYGTVRDQYGTPLMTDQVLVILQAPNGAQSSTTIVPGIAFDQNYQLQVPMDSGLTADPYEPDALVAGAFFQIYVVVGTTTNLPIQMTGNFSKLGQPGGQTRIDLTLGIDSNADGIPDAWELAFLATIGSNLSLANLTASTRLTPDGLTLLQQFYAGTYPFNPQEPFIVSLIGLNHGAPLLQFPTMTGRYYTLFGSPDLQTWTALNFTVPADGTNPATRGYYFSQGIQDLQVQPQLPSSGSAIKFFKVMLQ